MPMKLGGLSVSLMVALLAGCTGVIDGSSQEADIDSSLPATNAGNTGQGPAGIAGTNGGPADEGSGQAVGNGGSGAGPDGGGGVASAGGAVDGPIASEPLPPLPPGAPCRVAAPMRRLTVAQYKNALRDIFAGAATLPADFALATVGLPESGFSTDPNFNAVDLAVTRDLHGASESVALSILEKLPTIVACAATPSAACAETFIDQVGRRAFRRPLLAAERTRLLNAFKLGTGADAFKDGIAAAVTTLLQSPQFLYQAEVGEAVAGETGVLRLSPYEVASRLSFSLWDSVPDAALLDAAAKGSLATSEGVRAQAERLLNDEKARATIVRFAREWIHLEVPKPGVDRLDSAYTPALSAAMQSELDSFVTASFLGAGTSIGAFFTSAAPFGNATLRTFYEQSGGMGPRAGLLTQPALLTGIANPQDTSPIRRSVFVRRQLTCEDFPHPPDDALAVEGSLPSPANATARERSAVRMQNTRCVGCHTLIDPLGFGFEAFDELGRYRTQTASGVAIDARGDFVAPASGDLGGKFDTLAELGQRLGASPTVHQCVVKQLFRFNYGRLEGSADSCAIEGAVERWGNELNLRELLLTLVSADEFRFRRVQ